MPLLRSFGRIWFPELQRFRAYGAGLLSCGSWLKTKRRTVSRSPFEFSVVGRRCCAAQIRLTGRSALSHFSSGSVPACKGHPPRRRGIRPGPWSAWSARRRFFPSANARLLRRASWADDRRSFRICPCSPRDQSARASGW